MQSFCVNTAALEPVVGSNTLEGRSPRTSLEDRKGGTLKSSESKDSTCVPLSRRLPAMPPRDLGQCAQSGTPGNGLLFLGRNNSSNYVLRGVRRELLEEILALVAERYQRSPADLRACGGKRSDMVWARKMAMAVMHRLGASTHEIADVIGLGASGVHMALQSFAGYVESYPHTESEYVLECAEAVRVLSKTVPTGKLL